MSERKTLNGKLRLLSGGGSHIFPVEIWALWDGDTERGWRFVNLEEHRKAWCGLPVLCAYVNGGRTIGDGHNQEAKHDDDGQSYQSFTGATAERIVGATPENPDGIQVVEKGGHNWLVVRAHLWAWYARELVEKIRRSAEQGGAMSVSIEALADKSHMEGEVEVITAYIPLGITILGDGVRPAVPGAHIAMMSAEEATAFTELKLRAAAYLTAAEKKPHEMKRRNGETMNLTKSQRDAMQQQFPGRFLVADQVGDDGSVCLCLMSAGGKTEVCNLASIGATVHEDTIREVPALVHFSLGDGQEITADAGEMLALAAGDADALRVRAEKAEAALATLQAEVERMRAQENARRVLVAKERAKATLAAFNSNRGDQMPEDALKELLASIDAGEYTTCTGKDGAWNGEATVESAVKALCADFVMRLDAKAAEKSKKAAMTWGHELRGLSAGGTEAGTYGDMLARYQD